MSDWTWFDIHGLVGLRVEAGCPAERQLVEMLRPFLTTAPPERVDITLSSRPVHLEAASHGEHAYRYEYGDAGTRALEVRRDRVVVTSDGQGYGVNGRGELLTALLPILDRVAVTRGAGMIHAATVAVGGAGVCLPAWGGVGKTSTIARFMKDPDSQFMGDDWAFVDVDGNLLSYVKPMFLKPHHRNLYPHVFEQRRKPLAPSRFTDTVARAATFVHPAIIRYPALADITRRWSPEHIMVRPEDAFPGRAAADRVPLRVVCFVERYDGSAAMLEEKSRAWTVTRMLGNYHAELPGTSRDLVVALGATGVVGLETYFAEKAEVLAKSIAGVSTHLLRVPIDWDAATASELIASTAHDLLEKAGSGDG